MRYLVKFLEIKCKRISPYGNVAIKSYWCKIMSNMRSKLFILFIILVVILVGCFLWTLLPAKFGIRTSTFTHLPGWADADTKQSMLTFQVSCKAFLKQDPKKSVGSDYLDLNAEDWYPACKEAMMLQPLSSQNTKQFFEKWFIPVEFVEKKPVEGLFTGYYMPLLKGSLTRTKEYNVPLYDVPSNLLTINLGLFAKDLKNRNIVGRISGSCIIPFYTRAEINQGAIENKAPVVAWVDSLIDRSFLEIEGSGLIQLKNGKQIAVGYSGQNGAAYTALAKVLIDKGVMTRDNASMQHIRSYLESHPNEINSVLNANKSFVFFQKLKQPVALGTLGTPLTPGYSLAIDRKWIPLGIPLWLNTTRPDDQLDEQKTLQRLMIAQDTGGAIRGMVRGDVYWGAGEKAASIAGKMKNFGNYWILIPKNTINRFKDKFV